MLEYAPGLPSAIETDPVRLEQILRNFLGNALKFTESGSITLGLVDDNEGVRFVVRDTGESSTFSKLQGIAEKIFLNLFEPHRVGLDGTGKTRRIFQHEL